MSAPLIAPFLAARPLEAVGGKALALGKMLRVGFPVPPGFVVTSHAFHQMTPLLETAILAHFDQLGAQLVAVRSSAVGEDGPTAAWAGQLDTFLNVTREQLLQRIQECWQSIESPRATAYAAQKQLTRGKVAVIIQAMVQSEVSGVAFSQNPVTKNTDQLVIEAGLGLGEAIVSGEITPDTYLVDKRSLHVLETHLSLQVKRLDRLPTGQTTWHPCGTAGATQKLPTQQINALSALVQKLETYFAHPVDVEWAISKETLFIVQCRPITTLSHAKII